MVDHKSNPSREDVTKINALYHDSIAESYDVRMVFAHPKVKELYSKIFSEYILPRVSNGDQFSALDIGCGSGYLEQFFSEKINNVLGIDVSEKMLELAKSKFPSFNFKNADVYEYLKENNQLFDLVISNSFYHHLKDYQAVLEQVARSVKPGGALYMGLEPNYYSYRFLAPFKFIFRKFFHEKLVENVAEKLSGSEYEEIAEYHLFYGNGINIRWLKKNLRKQGFSSFKLIFTARHLIAALSESTGTNFFRFVPDFFLDHAGILSRDFHLIAYKDNV
ncbi:MAG: hypothetical protein COT91_04615 [Candidatus Doudnabacteria bacterium CG10_big_fil_rev_8_21_14_0_10_41_10]|uniref:Methyltransferase domain-containing protein n=1 Tax=Candidatus Doudnabacteria bacterium CG10_big_fil_rev_8_21_14_0_10_41_10 TaxID=1974551 RepID=A0A2H0VCI9_9BACT|nr:MAG: hypothetical protein COT91_04615 [Candidatus Doudnabacteria bacterium CG10_big_fil_rev_8_21_14_0_10_41_10]